MGVVVVVVGVGVGVVVVGVEVVVVGVVAVVVGVVVGVVAVVVGVVAVVVVGVVVVAIAGPRSRGATRALASLTGRAAAAAPSDATPITAAERPSRRGIPPSGERRMVDKLIICPAMRVARPVRGGCVTGVR